MEEGDGHGGFAEAVRAWRERRGWTQEQLSHASGLSTRAIRSLERGRTLSPRRTTVQMLADALQVPRTRLMATVRRATTDADPDTDGAADDDGQNGASGGIASVAALIPRELPPDLADDVLDAREVVTALIAPPTAPYCGVVVTVAAPQSSELAIRAAHQVAPKFPDGQLYANLAGTPPIPPAEILRRFLRSLEIAERPAGTSPFATDELAAAFRSVLAGRRILIVLDGARSEAQIRPLIPAEARCALLVAYEAVDSAASPPEARTS